MPQSSKATESGRGESKQFRLAEFRTRVLSAILAVLLCGGAGYVALRRVGAGVVNLSYDLPFLVHRAGGGENVVTIFLDRLKGERLDRSIQGPLLDRLRQAGARAVIYDIIFDQEWPEPEVDEAFADAIRRFRGVDKLGNPIPGASRGFVVLACGRRQIGHAGVVGEQLVPPTDLLLSAAGDEFGLVALVHVDFVVRELVNGTKDEPSAAWKAAVAMGADLDESVRLEPRWINYAGPPIASGRGGDVPAIISIPVDAVLSDFNPELFRGKIAVIGGMPGIVSPQLGEDLFSTPFHRVDFRGRLPYMSGVEIQANILANLLDGNWLRRSSQRLDLILVLAVALAAGIGLVQLRPMLAITIAAAGFGVLAAAGLITMHFGGFWFPWSVAAFVQLPVALVGGTAANFYLERHFRIRITQEQRRLQEAFSRYVSPDMLNRIVEEDFHLRLGGDKINATMMFTDIESFTDMCQEVFDPELIVENLNGYFERTTEHIFEHNGVVIKFIGDAIFAAWGVPFADKDAPLKAARAAWKLFENVRFIAGGDELPTRIGLHCGEVVAGNIGSPRHIDYTLIGDSVNLASRLEGMNKILGTRILLSEAIQVHLDGEFVSRRVGQFRVKGRRDATTVYELLGPVSQIESIPWVSDYHEALRKWEEGNLAEAKQLFTKSDQARRSGDGPSRFFLELISENREYRDGIVELSEK